MTAPATTALQEWRRFWPVPISAGLGYSLAVLHIYGSGSFIVPLQEAFGWSRAFTSIGLTISGLSAAVFAVPLGILIDRIGPRPIGLIGALLMAGAYALFGTATGSKANWILLWMVLSFANLWAQSTIWTSAVASRFEKSRGLALAIALSGASVSAWVFPVMATWLIGEYGWRLAFPIMSALWLVVTYPFIFFYFRGAQDDVRQKRATPEEAAIVLTGVSLAEGARTAAFYKLLVASGLFTFTAVAIIYHMVALLTDQGAEPLHAAWVASLIGIFSIVGRLGTGLVLDRVPAQFFGAGVFTLPILACALLLLAPADPVSQAVAASIFGLTLGAETDIIGYLTSRHFGVKNFGAFFGAMVAALAVGSALGPLAAGATFDNYGSYDPFLMVTMACMAVSSVALATLGPYRFTAHG